MPWPVRWRSGRKMESRAIGALRASTSPLLRVFFESGVDPTIPSPTPQKKRGGSGNDRNEDSANPVDRNHMCNWTGFALFSWRCY